MPYLDGMKPGPGEHEQFFQPMRAEETDSLYQHCACGIDHALSLTGTLGLPLMGAGEAAHPVLDGVVMARADGPVSVPIDGRDHHLLMFV